MKPIPFVYLLAVPVIALFVSCGTQHTPVKLSEPALKTELGAASDLLKINSLYLDPIQFEGESREAAVGASGAYSDLKDAFKEATDLELKFADVSGKDQTVAASVMSDLNPSQQLARAVQKGREAGAEAVLLTRISRYIGRSGTAMGTDQPAQVVFTMSLVRLDDWKEVWAAHYAYRDEAISDNLYKIGSRTAKGWSTAQHVLVHGFKAAAEDFANRRSRAFEVSK